MSARNVPVPLAWANIRKEADKPQAQAESNAKNAVFYRHYSMFSTTSQD